MDENRFAELEEEFERELDREFAEQEALEASEESEEKEAPEDKEKLFEEKLFAVEEYYTEKDYLKYCKYRYQKGQKWLKIVWILYLLFALYQVIDAAIKQSVLLLVISIILFGVGLWMLLVGSYFIPYRRTLKQSKNFFAKRIISFYDNHLECDADGNVRSTKYENLKQIFETEDAFYLIIGKGSVLMVFKNCLTLGTAQDLCQFLRRVTEQLNL